MPGCELPECPIAGKVERLEEQLDEYQTRSANSHREIYSRLNTLETSSAVTQTRYDAIIEKLDGITNKVDDLEQKPAKRWEAVVAAAIGALVGGLVTLLLTMLTSGHIG